MHVMSECLMSQEHQELSFREKYAPTWSSVGRANPVIAHSTRFRVTRSTFAGPAERQRTQLPDGRFFAFTAR